MKKQERQVLENAVKTLNSVVDFYIEENEYAISKVYVNNTTRDLLSYASIQLRFAGMKENDYDDFCDTVFEIGIFIEDKINNAKENKHDRADGRCDDVS